MVSWPLIETKVHCQQPIISVFATLSAILLAISRKQKESSLKVFIQTSFVNASCSGMHGNDT